MSAAAPGHDEFVPPSDTAGQHLPAFNLWVPLPTNMTSLSFSGEQPPAWESSPPPSCADASLLAQFCLLTI